MVFIKKLSGGSKASLKTNNINIFSFVNKQNADCVEDLVDYNLN